jgi:serine/threonine protein kinase
MREEEQRAGLPPRALPEALALLEPAAMALARAHRRGLVHAGLTPSVIVVLGNPRRPPATLRLLDFGVTRAMGDARAGAASGQTSRGTFAFTPASYHPAFAAPEQLEHGGHPVTPATDVFSFALVVAYLLAYPTFDLRREPSHGRPRRCAAPHHARRPRRRREPRDRGGLRPRARARSHPAAAEPR